MYDNAEEAGNRLNSTVILYDGSPVFVRECYGRKGNLMCKALPIPSLKPKDEISFAIEDDKTDYRNLSLGYVNGKKGCVLLSRIPVRGEGYKQGLHQRNVHISGIRPDADIGLDGEEGPLNGVNWNNLIRTAGFSNMMKNKYPTIPQCLDQMLKEKNVVSTAFNRYFCVYRDPVGLLNLHYKGEKVGYSEFSEKFKIGPDFLYLREVLIENGVQLK